MGFNSGFKGLKISHGCHNGLYGGQLIFNVRHLCGRQGRSDI